ncbi:alpha/beta fold hydrolase [Baekduia sp.]|uniref:alpha/beta fold hydrolase n=1 Tax=Baekduia sp. TaxID=2600305 RepID=UPI002E06A747|nr:alpha/beta fold hydrolase [Baekduia sp.]
MATPSLAFTRRGSGPPLVLLHPLGADRRVWDPILDRLALERDVIAVDLPGFGDSPPLAELMRRAPKPSFGESAPLALEDGQTPTPERLAAAVRRFVETELGLDGHAWHVAGNSLGGWVALALGLDGAVASVTAIAPAGLWTRPLGPKPSDARRAARLAAPIAGVATRSARLRRLILAGSVGHPERVPPPAAAHLVRAYAHGPDFPAVNAAMRAGHFTKLAEIGVPVTLAWPQLDRLIARPRQLAPHVRNVTLIDCGHIPTWDNPEAVTTVLLEGSALHVGAR